MCVCMYRIEGLGGGGGVWCVDGRMEVDDFWFG